MLEELGARAVLVGSGGRLSRSERTRQLASLVILASDVRGAAISSV